MDNVKIVLDYSGVQELLKSAELADVCEMQAQRMTQATGVKYEADVYIGRRRVNAKGVKGADDD